MNKFKEDLNRLKRFFKIHPKRIGALFAFVILAGFFKLYSKNNYPENNLYQVTSEVLTKTLHFNGHLAPLSETPLTSPVDANIEKIHVHFGETVKKNEVVFSLNSSELHRLYNDALTEYLKAKDTHNITQNRFNGTSELWKSGLISKNNYLSEKSTLHNSRISLMQATHKLNEIIKKIDNGVLDDPKNLKLSDIAKVEQALTQPHQFVTLKARSAGVLLSPPSNRNEGQNKPIGVGHSIKAGQVLALVGDLRGLHIEIEIPEVDIKKIQVNMPAKVTGVAFTGLTLTGKVISINAEANASGNGMLPTFNALIAVEKLTPEQQAMIKVGMSATVELAVSSKKMLLIPIEAIQLENNQAVVYVKTAQGIKKRVVSTGEAEAGRVVITSGLQQNEQILYDPKSTH